MILASQHGCVGGAGVEPDIERVAVFFVLIGLVAQEFTRVQCLPGFNAAFFDTLRDLFKQFSRARMELPCFFMNRERHGHAPLTLARQRPVRAVGDHGVKLCATPGGVEGCCVDPCQRAFAQRRAAVFGLHVHAGEPLAGGVENDRGFVAPAMHIAERVLVHAQ